MPVAPEYANEVARAKRDHLAQERARVEAAYQKELPLLTGEESKLLKAGDYTDAWKFAETHGDPTKHGLGAGGLTQNSLVADLETSRGLESLGVQHMTPAQMQSFYDAASKSWNYQTLGHNPYGSTEWGDKGYVAGDAKVNAATSGDNQVADLARFAGKQPDKSFVSKWGAPILEVVAAIVAPELIPLFAEAGIGATAAYATIGAAAGAGGAALSGGNVAEGAALGGLTGGLGPGGAGAGIAGDISGAVGGGVVGSTVGGAVVGAGAGAIGAGITGGDVGKAALGGAAGGAYTGSGLAGDVSGAAGGGIVGNVASGAVGSAIRGAVTGQPPTAGGVARSAGGSLGSQWAQKALGGG